MRESAGQSAPHSSPLVQAIATLNPAYFALVMATGIVSTAGLLLGKPWLALPLFWLNIVQYLVLVVLTAARLVMFPRVFFADMIDHKRGVGFFTTVAATCVLGSQCWLIGESRLIAVGLWCVGSVLWLVLTYTIFTCFSVEETKPLLQDGIHGGWLVSVVAAQSVSLLGGLLAEGFGQYREHVLFFALVMWLGGGMLYIWIISLIFYRYTFFPMSPADLSPPYWINMGAMAISTVAGTILIAEAGDSALLSQLLPFLKGFTLFYWATATWWIPMLVILGIWRHLYRRFPLRYDPQFWGVVFPLGMYTVCTVRLSRAINLSFLMEIAECFVYFAIAAWLLTFAAMILALIKGAGSALSKSPPS
jgi:tellurite resistance protein TehA-like permease